MRKSPLPLILLLLSVSACAPSVYRADVGAIFVDGDGEVALQNAGGTLVLHNAQNRLDQDLDMGDLEASPYLRLEWEHDQHRVRTHGFGFESAGNGLLAGDFGGIPSGSLVMTSMDFFNLNTSYSFEVLGSDDYRVGLGGQLGFYLLEIDARSATLSEAVETDVIVPAPFIEAEYHLGPVSLLASGSLMAGDLGDAKGRYVDFEALTRWRVSNELDLLAGYRYFVMDSYGVATGRDFDADLDFDGWFIGGGVRF